MVGGGRHHLGAAREIGGDRGDPGATRNVQSTPNPSGVIHALPGGIEGRVHLDRFRDGQVRSRIARPRRAVALGEAGVARARGASEEDHDAQAVLYRELEQLLRGEVVRRAGSEPAHVAEIGEDVLEHRRVAADDARHLAPDHLVRRGVDPVEAHRAAGEGLLELPRFAAGERGRRVQSDVLPCAGVQLAA